MVVNQFYFFEEFVKKVGENIANICYALNGATVESGRLYGPETIGVDTDDYNIVRRANYDSIDISFSLRKKFDEMDSAIMCVTCAADEVLERGLKIWVEQ